MTVVSGWDEHNVSGIELRTFDNPYKGDNNFTLFLCNLLTFISSRALPVIRNMS